MVKVNDDYIIEIDSLNYTVKRDEHRKNKVINKVTGETSEIEVFTTVGYFYDLATSISGIIKDMNRRKLGSGTHTLQEAVKIVINNNSKFIELLERALKEG